MAFIDVIKEKAKNDVKTIVLPEGMDRRTWEGAVKAKAEGLANLIILATPEMVKENAEGLDITGITVIDPTDSDKTDEYIDLLVELRKKKGTYCQTLPLPVMRPATRRKRMPGVQARRG